MHLSTEYLLCITNKIVNLDLQLESRRQNLYCITYFLNTSSAPTWTPVPCPFLHQECPCPSPTVETQPPSTLPSVVTSSTEDCFTFLFFLTLLLKAEMIFPTSKFPESFLQYSFYNIVNILYINCVKSSSPIIGYILF